MVSMIVFLEVSVFRCTGEDMTTEYTTTESTNEDRTNIETITTTTQEDTDNPEFHIVTYSDGETATLTGGLDLGSHLVIPSTIDGYTIITIGIRAFEYNYSLIGVTLPSTLETIAFAAFSNCINLEEINIPYGVTSIGTSAFANCTSLTEMYIPSTVMYIDESTFNGCTGITFYVQATSAPEGWGEGWNNGNEVNWGVSQETIS